MQNRALWRDVRFLQILAQVLFVLALALAAGLLYANVQKNLTRQGLTVGYGFLQHPAGFDIGETIIPFTPSNTYGRAILVGLVNTLLVTVWGILLTTIVGVVVGIARLSSNWLVRQLAGAYVGVIRNTPLIIQLMFWYFGIFLQLPPVRQAIALPGQVFLTQRGLYMPWPRATAAFKGWQPYVIAALVSFALLWLLFRVVQSQNHDAVPLKWRLAALLVPVAIAAIGFVQQPEPPMIINTPLLSGLNFRGGMALSPEFAALLFGLVFYTGAFIAEVVRAGIQAVPRGQVEAATALGLTPGLALRLVIFPQALRVIIPPTTSQYLNLAKNSSLAIAIGFPDLFSVAGTVFNQTGAAVEIIVIMMVSYLIMSLITSLLMNIYNQRTRLVER